MIYNYIHIKSFQTGYLMSINQIKAMICYEISLGEYAIFDHRI